MVVVPSFQAHLESTRRGWNSGGEFGYLMWEAKVIDVFGIFLRTRRTLLEPMKKNQAISVRLNMNLKILKEDVVLHGTCYTSTGTVVCPIVREPFLNVQ